MRLSTSRAAASAASLPATCRSSSSPSIWATVARARRWRTSAVLLPIGRLRVRTAGAGRHIERFAVLGFDTGGAIAQVAAAAHPDRINRLALMSCDAFEHFPPRLIKPFQWAATEPPTAYNTPRRSSNAPTATARFTASVTDVAARHQEQSAPVPDRNDAPSTANAHVRPTGQAREHGCRPAQTP